jgi:myo-inositol-1(or 4)-monophosphatase
MDSPLTFASDLASRTGKKLLESFTPNGTFTSLKEDYSVVTEADLAADQMIAEAIQRAYPEEALISEELQPTIGETKSAVWIVDPLDGTTNFSLGMPIWGVSIARVVDGWPKIAAVYFPVLNEMFTAQEGAGAFLNGERIHTQPPIPSKPTSFFSCCTRTFQQYHVTIRYKTRILGSACYSMCAVARGMAVLGFEATPKIWDIAGSWLIVAEAGGDVDTITSSKPFPLRVNYDYRRMNYPTISGANSEMVLQARTQIKPKIITS